MKVSVFTKQLLKWLNKANTFMCDREQLNGIHFMPEALVSSDGTRIHAVKATPSLRLADGTWIVTDLDEGPTLTSVKGDWPERIAMERVSPVLKHEPREMWIDGRLLLQALQGMLDDERYFTMLRLEISGCSPYVLAIHSIKGKNTGTVLESTEAVMYALIMGAMPARGEKKELYHWTPASREPEEEDPELTPEDPGEF